MVKGFRAFIMKGNVLDLAVAVVIGAAFTAIVTALVTGFITPLIAAIFGKPNLDDVGNFVINDAHFSIGIILTAIINFLIVAAAVYFILIYPVQKLQERRTRGEEPVPPEPTDVQLLKEIRDLLAARNQA
jgi:large conductance mechanosensitive channel